MEPNSISKQWSRTGPTASRWLSSSKRSPEPDPEVEPGPAAVGPRTVRATAVSGEWRGRQRGPGTVRPTGSRMWSPGTELASGREWRLRLPDAYRAAAKYHSCSLLSR